MNGIVVFVIVVLFCIILTEGLIFLMRKKCPRCGTSSKRISYGTKYTGYFCHKCEESFWYDRMNGKFL